MWYLLISLLEKKRAYNVTSKNWDLNVLNTKVFILTVIDTET
jgi:hypothetical protein